MNFYSTVSDSLLVYLCCCTICVQLSVPYSVTTQPHRCHSLAYFWPFTSNGIQDSGHKRVIKILWYSPPLCFMFILTVNFIWEWWRLLEASFFPQLFCHWCDEFSATTQGSYLKFLLISQRHHPNDDLRYIANASLTSLKLMSRFIFTIVLSLPGVERQCKCSHIR